MPRQSGRRVDGGGYRSYLLMTLIIMICITALVFINAYDNWGAIAMCLTCLLLLTGRLVYAHYVWRRAAREREAYSRENRIRHATTERRVHAARNNVANELPEHFIEDEFVPYNAEPIFTITSARHDPPPQYDDVTKDVQPPPVSVHFGTPAAAPPEHSPAAAPQGQSIGSPVTADTDDGLPPSYSEALQARLTKQLGLGG